MPTLSTVPVNRLSSIPWSALTGLASVLEEGVSGIQSGRRAERVLDRLFRRHSSLNSEERQALAEVIFGLALWRIPICHVLGTPSWDGLSAMVMVSAFLHVIAGLSQDAARLISGASQPGREGLPPDWPTRLSFPRWIAEIFDAELGPEAELLAQAINQPGSIFFRSNTLRTTREALAETLAGEGVQTAPCQYSPVGLRVLTPRPNIYGLKSYQSGLFEVQDEGSQLLSLLLDAKPGHEVLDLCAGAGGKTLALAAVLGNRGTLHAYDTDGERLERLRRRAQKAGAQVRIHFPGTLPPDLRVDRVLVDAPCSELGTLRRGPDARFFVSPTSPARFALLQQTLLHQAASHLRPGGKVVYATCTLGRVENQDVARTFETSHPVFRRLAPNVPASFVRQGFFQSWPHIHDTDGFFAAVYECYE